MPTIGLAQSNVNIAVNAIDPTARWSLEQSVQYNINKQGIWGQTALTANRPWPNLTLESQYGRRSERDLEKIPAEPSADFRFADLPTQEWRENTLLLGMDFPLSWSTSTQKRSHSSSEGGFKIGRFDPFKWARHTIHWTSTWVELPDASQNKPAASAIPSVLDLFPRVGISIEGGHTQLLANENKPKQLCQHSAVSASLWPHHHLLVYGAAEERLGPYPLPYQSRLARGQQTASTQILNLSAGYAFPIAYPDVSLKRFLYIKRVRGGGFVDVMWDGKQQMTYGFNLTMDVHPMRLPLPIPVGLDIGRNIQTNSLYIGPSIDILY